MQQSDIFVDSDLLVESQKVVQANKNIPVGYVPVTLCSRDVLSPSVLHFRNYSMDELLEIVSSPEELQFNAIVNKALNSMVLEDFDCSKLHIECIKQILMTLFLNFWGKSLPSRPYYVDVKGDHDDPKNIAYTDIDLTKVSIDFIDRQFSNPFIIEDIKTKQRIGFKLPTVEQTFLADEYVKKSFQEREAEYRDIKANLELQESLISSGNMEGLKSIQIDPERKKEYTHLQDEKSLVYLKVLQCQLIDSIDGQTLSTIEDQLDAYKNKVSANLWTEYKEIIKKYATFGVNNSYTFYVDGKPLTRGFSFRLLEFLPSVEQSENSRYTVHFTH